MSAYQSNRIAARAELSRSNAATASLWGGCAMIPLLASIVVTGLIVTSSLGLW